MKIFISVLDGNKFSVEVPDHATVDQLKEEVTAIKHVSVDRQRLIFNGSEVYEGTLTCQGIREGALLHLVVRDVNNIRINIKLPSGQTITREVEENENVSKVKTILAAELPYTEDQMKLSFSGRELASGKLQHYRVQNGSTLSLSLREIQIFVLTFDSKTLTFHIQSFHTVMDLKKMIFERIGVPVKQQCLNYEGRVVENGLLSAYGVRSNSTIHMTGRLRGG